MIGLTSLLLSVLVLVPRPQVDPVSPDVVLNEFMPHPLASATQLEGEWIELVNPSPGWVSLSGWKIRNGLGEEIVLCSFLVPPNGYAVIGACGDALRNGGYQPDIVYSDFHIDDTGSLILLDPTGVEVDRIDYDASWAVEPGRTCEKINPGWASNLPSSWDSATDPFGNGDLGTPGAENSVFQNSFGQNTWAFIKAFVQ